MATHESYTRLLGLALRGGNLVMGSDAVQGAAHAGTARLLLLSADASVRTCKDAAQWSERGNCLLVALPCDKAELGAALGRASVAVAALTDTGLAAAVGERLAQYDSERYGAMAERLRLKSKRAGERARARSDGATRKREAVPSKPGAAPRKRGTRPDGAAAQERKSRPDTAQKRKARPDGNAPRKRDAALRKWETHPDGASPRKRDAAARKRDGTAPRKPDGASSRKAALTRANHATPSPGAGNFPKAERRRRSGAASSRRRGNASRKPGPPVRGRPQPRPHRKSD